MTLFARKKPTVETWPPRPGRCGLIFGWVETPDGPKLMRYGGGFRYFLVIPRP